MNEPKSSHPIAEGIGYIAVATVLIATMVIMVRQLFFGVDLVDEASYLAFPYRLLSGDHPLTHDRNFLQLSSLLLVPFLKVFLWVKGDLDGSILFVRWLYLLFRATTAYVIYRLLTKRVGRPPALLISLIVLAFIPYLPLPTLSYSTMGSLFFTLSIFLGFQSRSKKASPLVAFSTGFVASISAVCYPPLLAGVGVFFYVLWTKPRPIELVRVFPYLVGSAIILLPAGYYVVENLNQLKDIVDYISIRGVHTWSEPLEDLGAQFLLNRIFKKLVLFGFVFWFLTKKADQAFATALFLLLLPWLAFFAGAGAEGYAFYYSLAGPLFLFIPWKKDPETTLWYWWGWVPSFVGALACALFSRNGNPMGAATVALVPAMMVVAVLSSLALKAISEADKEPLFLLLPVFLPALVVQLHLGVHLPGSNWGDCPFDKLTTTVQAGPYKGLRTTEKKKEFLASVTADTIAAEASEGKIIFYPNFPAGYLLTGMTAVAPAAWTCNGLGTSAYCSDRLKARLPDANIVVKIKQQVCQCDSVVEAPATSEVDEAVQTNYRQALAKPFYSIFSSRAVSQARKN